MADDPDQPIIPDKPTGPFPKLTASTSNPYGDHPDEPIVRPVTPWVYVDMRNQLWFCWWLGQGWLARPTPEAAAFYGLKVGSTFAAASDAKGTIEMIEANIERDRIAKRDAGGFPWWLLVLLGVMWASEKKKR